MSCRRICRELLWLTRFGELGPSSAPHLDHLADCRSCRDEVGYDRELVQHLRLALAARIEAATPPSEAWYGILARTQLPEPSGLAALWSRFGALAVRLRTGTAMAGMGLALVLTINMELVPVGLPTPEPPDQPVVQPAGLRQVPRLPTGATPFGSDVPNNPNDVAASEPNDLVGSEWPDPEGVLNQVQTPPRSVTPGVEEEEAPVEGPATEMQLQVVFGATRTPELVEPHDNGEARGPRHGPDLVDTGPGEPF